MRSKLDLEAASSCAEMSCRSCAAVAKSPLGLFTCSALARSCAARRSRTRKVTSRPAAARHAPKYPPTAPAPTTRIRMELVSTIPKSGCRLLFQLHSQLFPLGGAHGVLVAQGFYFCRESLCGFGSGEDGLLLLGGLDASFKVRQLGFKLGDAALKLLELDGVQAFDRGFGSRRDGCSFAGGFVPPFPFRFNGRSNWGARFGGADLLHRFEHAGGRVHLAMRDDGNGGSLRGCFSALLTIEIILV